LAETALLSCNSSQIGIISGELKIKPWQVENTLKLLSEDCTVPFISRYRKEATGELDEIAITQVRDRAIKLVEMEQRRLSITIDDKPQLTGRNVHIQGERLP